jgi:hypothetical protein
MPGPTKILVKPETVVERSATVFGLGRSAIHSAYEDGLKTINLGGWA